MGVLAMPNRRARSLRGQATDAERKLWQELRILKDEGRHFRRQVPLAGYIADFACHSCQLVIELDGGQHSQDAEAVRDALRTLRISRDGYRVIRFWNSEVVANLEGVVDIIRHAAGLDTVYDHREGYTGATHTPNPSPQGGGA